MIGSAQIFSRGEKEVGRDGTLLSSLSERGCTVRFAILGILGLGFNACAYIYLIKTNVKILHRFEFLRPGFILPLIFAYEDFFEFS